MLDAIPDIHDWYCENVNYQPQILMLTVTYRKYDEKQNTLVVDMRKNICFAGVCDIYALPCYAEENLKPREKTRLVAWVESKLAFLHLHPPPLENAQQLIAMMDGLWGEISNEYFGVPLDSIEPYEQGFVIETHLDRRFYVRARSVDWCN